MKVQKAQHCIRGNRPALSPQQKPIMALLLAVKFQIRTDAPFLVRVCSGGWGHSKGQNEMKGDTCRCVSSSGVCVCVCVCSVTASGDDAGDDMRAPKHKFIELNWCIRMKTR